MKKLPEKIVERQVVSGVIATKQVLSELPHEEIVKMGGLRELFERTKINIADSLRSYGFNCEAQTISSLDTKKIDSVDQLEYGLMNSLGFC